MTIGMMTDEKEAHLPNVERKDNYPGHEITRISHASRCPNYNPKVDKAFGEIPETCLEGCRHHKPLYMKTTHEGVVISLREANGYHDSDFFALVWDEENQKTTEVQYASTRGWTYPNWATPDATPDILEKVKVYRQQLHDERKERERIYAEQLALRDAAEVEKLSLIPVRGAKVVILRGKNKDRTGLVIWRGLPRRKVYGTSAWDGQEIRDEKERKPRVGVQFEDGEKYWGPGTIVEAI